MSLTAADRDRCDRWWGECLARSGLPADVEPVKTRLIRQVGRARLPDAGEVYLKVMNFPRSKDRLRYLFRALPCHHEARMLRVVAELGIPCPEVLQVRGSRAFGLPRLSMLVMRALDRSESEPVGGAMAALAGKLAKAGVFHPDLHRNNYVLLSDGRLAVLDLHSAKRLSPGLSRAQRLSMAARLIGGSPSLAEDPSALVQAGLLRAQDVEIAERRAQLLARDQTIRQIRRCLRDSTEFQLRRKWNGVLYQRRSGLCGGTWIDGGPELRQWWIGDRALEVLEQRPPGLRALFQKTLWLPGRHSVYIAEPLDRAAILLLARTLLGGYTALRKLLTGAESPEDQESAKGGV